MTCFIGEPMSMQTIDNALNYFNIKNTDYGYLSIKSRAQTIIRALRRKGIHTNVNVLKLSMFFHC